MMSHTIETIQEWVDGYAFIDNSTASQDILKEIVGLLPDHRFSYGPTVGDGYTLEITGDIVSQTFTVKAATA